MSDRNGGINGFTSLFPIKSTTDRGAFRSLLRSFDSHPRGSPLSSVDLVHMARFVIVDRLAFQGEPAAHDRLMSAYLLFACDFDGSGVDELVVAMATKTPELVIAVWEHCVGFPGIGRADDRYSDLVRYFCRCRIPTTLFLADQPGASVSQILRALVLKQALADFVQQHQGSDPAIMQQELHTMWQACQSAPTPIPGSC